jgi:hypothetical protein
MEDRVPGSLPFTRLKSDILLDNLGSSLVDGDAPIRVLFMFLCTLSDWAEAICARLLMASRSGDQQRRMVQYIPRQQEAVGSSF